jgi:threonine/homoserine/homoserine lactone efflux protein
VTLVIAASMRAGLVTVVGASSGNAVLLPRSRSGWLTWFEMLRFVGAAYLIWLGIQAWAEGRRRRRTIGSTFGLILRQPGGLHIIPRCF